MVLKVSSRYTAHLNCHAGCSGCCQHHLSVFPVEAASIRKAINSLPQETQECVRKQALAVNEQEARSESIACPLLVDDKCAIYNQRPLICRTQGLPLLIQAEDDAEYGTSEVDFCPLNFTTPEAIDDLDEDHLVPLDALNLKLAIVNLNYCREAGINDEESGQRIPMSEIILKSLPKD